MTLITAGHETTANALNWLWYLLAQHPEVERRLHDEIDRVLGGRLPTAEDVEQLRYVEMVLLEAMRLYPPAWGIERRALRDQEIGGCVIPAGAVVLMPTFLMNRDERFFPDPLRFDPERFAPEAVAGRPRHAFLLFGGGPRQCIGNAFALIEGVLVVSVLAQRWRLRLAPGQVVDGAADRHASPEGRAADDRRAPGGMSAGDDPGPGLAEALALWATLAVLCVLAWITYARLPARDFYNVSGTGVRAGASRVLVLLGWPISIIAIALLAIAVDRLLADDTLGRGARRLVVVLRVGSLGLCLTIVWPGVVNQDNLDAKPSNALAAIGVALALALTLWGLARRGVGRSPAPRRRRPCRRRAGRAPARRRDPLAVRAHRRLRRRRAGPAGDLHVEDDHSRGRSSAPARRPSGKPRGSRRHPARRHRARSLAPARPHAADAPADDARRLPRAGAVLRPRRRHPGRLARADRQARLAAHAVPERHPTRADPGLGRAPRLRRPRLPARDPAAPAPRRGSREHARPSIA